ncbi:N-acetylmuramoyl-L-alanine amidase [Paenibacillus sp. LMG 31458]|uniref:N-acetylmuramoyl-L-alanine amidase n=1 Tax=Paenibacillus phytorum TaxID=2654977 RepID=A0ABX1YAD9_9BACL|nr:N-acetylmuramoyl-L-alanine amidase [Paenibacillus phytorum]
MGGKGVYDDSDDAKKITNFLSAAWMSTEDVEAREEFRRLADELRKASGQQ